MSEAQATAALAAIGAAAGEVSGNPFDPDSFAHGGGLWDGKIITITSSKATMEALAYGDGKPVLNDKGQQSIQIGLTIKGIADGGDDKERSEVYTVGGKLVPTPDGEGFVSTDGGPAKFHANSGIGKFAAAAKLAGFDLSTLVVEGRQKLSRLVGARFEMRGEAKKGKDGKPLQDKKGYTKQAFYPQRFVGWAGGAHTGGLGVQLAAPPTGGNGAVAAGGGGDALKAKAVGAVLGALAGGQLTRADLVRTIAQQLAGDPQVNDVIGLIVRDDFHKGQAWQYDGVKASL